MFSQIGWHGRLIYDCVLSGLQNQHSKGNETESVILTSDGTNTINQTETVTEPQQQEANNSTVPANNDSTDENNVQATQMIVRTGINVF